MKVASLIALVAGLCCTLGANVLAHSHLTKAEVKAQAVELCVNEAEKRYGKEAVVYHDETARIARDPSRTHWNKSLQGATVKIKIKAQSKRTAKYSCLVKTDRTVTFSGGSVPSIGVRAY